MPAMMLMERLLLWSECTGLVLSLIDAEFYALFDDIIFQIDVLHFFKIYTSF